MSSDHDSSGSDSNILEFPDVRAELEARKREFEEDRRQQAAAGKTFSMIEMIDLSDCILRSAEEEWKGGERPDKALAVVAMARCSEYLIGLLKEVTGDRRALALVVAESALELLQQDADDKTRAIVATVRPVVATVARDLQAS